MNFCKKLLTKTNNMYSCFCRVCRILFFHKTSFSLLFAMNSDWCVTSKHKASMSLKNPLHMKWASQIKEIWKIWSGKLLYLFIYGGYQKIIFTDEKIFTVNEKINHENDHVYAKNFHYVGKKICENKARPLSFTCHGLVTYFVCRSIPLQFCRQSQAFEYVSVMWQKMGISAEFCSSSQSKRVTDMAAKQFARFYHCMILAMKKPWPQPIGLLPIAGVTGNCLQ